MQKACRRTAALDWRPLQTQGDVVIIQFFLPLLACNFQSWCTWLFWEHPSSYSCHAALRRWERGQTTSASPPSFPSSAGQRGGEEESWVTSSWPSIPHALDHVGSWWDISSTAAIKEKFGPSCGLGGGIKAMCLQQEQVIVVSGGCGWPCKRYHGQSVTSHACPCTRGVLSAEQKSDIKKQMKGKKNNLKKSQPNTWAQAELGTCKVLGKSYQHLNLDWIFFLTRSNPTVTFSWAVTTLGWWWSWTTLIYPRDKGFTAFVWLWIGGEVTTLVCCLVFLIWI